MSEQTNIRPAETAVAPEDLGRVDSANWGRLVAILVALVLYSEVAPMQLGMVSIIVPKLAASFPGAGAGVTWAVTIVGIAGGATMALLGKLGDLIGKKRVTLLCGLLFLIGALLCVLTHSWALFLVGRALGGASWAMTAVEYGLVRDLLPRKWIPVAVGVVGTGFGIGGVLTPIICGALTDHYSWHSVFWFLIIYVAVTTPLVMIAVPESPLRVKQKLDIIGAILFGASIGLILLYVSEGSTWGWAAFSSLAYLLVGLILFAAFIAWELRTPEPMIELSLLRSRAVAIPMAVAFLVTLAISAISIMIAYMFQTPKAADLEAQIINAGAAQAHVPPALVAKFVTFSGDISYANGFSTLQMALHITAWTAAFGMLFGVFGGWLCRIVGARILLITSGLSLLLACALWIPWHKTWQEQVFIGLLYGISFGFYYAANPNLLIDAVPADRQGISAGMLAVFGSIGTSVGTAIFTAIASAHPFRTIADNMGKKQVNDIPNVYTDTAYQWSYVAVGVIPAALTVALALALRTGRTPSRGGASEASLLTEETGAGTAGTY
ncbi:MFS transporter [Nocardia aurantia]|uniref:Multidrug resistance protein MdtL n=1 Tax=Nocardia aurantia TaxID=2585199 RepID=A0A7K0E0M6_9NOCA|nr:MFS transporter [Nocardia aurantia]MQY31368.1 Multidrug resistance protein MdtL [Nocardia aurantia]